MIKTIQFRNKEKNRRRTMNFDIYKELKEAAGKSEVLTQEMLSGHTTFRVGGPADYFVAVKDTQAVQNVTALCISKQIPYYILGNGSNILAGDGGYRGVIIQFGKEMSDIEVLEDGTIRAQAGALMAKIANAAYEKALGGFEFAAGIPGSIGGAMVMNAGAYGGEMKDVVNSVTVLTKENEIRVLTNKEMEFGYRTSAVAKNGYIVLEVELKLHEASREEIKEKMDDLKNRRITKQPLEFPSAGSTFKRPEGNFAGKLIEEAGLRGFRVGGAQVSEKHCGFVINREKATAKDVTELMNEVIKRVKENSGIELEPEVKRLGEF